MPHSISASPQRSPDDPLVISWSSPSLAMGARSAYQVKQSLFIIISLAVVAVFLKQFLYAAVLAAFTFVVYVLSSFVPDEVEHRIDGNGITTAGETHIWEDVDYFYFTKPHGHTVLNIALFDEDKPVTLVLGDLDAESVRFVMEESVPYRNAPQPSLFDRASDIVTRWFSLG